MSNFLAIATVTAALRRTLQAAVDADVPGAAVTTNRPQDSSVGTDGPGVNIYLYQVTPNTGWRNADLPTRRSNGDLLQCPKVALDLHYLLSFYGEETTLEPQRLLGSVARTLHARPVLTRQMIQETIADSAFIGFLANSDLYDAVELVKFTPGSLSLEELSKLWSVFFQTSYALSVSYQGTTVLIESEDIPQPALPVRERNLYVVTFKQPVIDRVISEAGEHEPIIAGSTLSILGQNLRGEITRILMAGIEVTPQEAGVKKITLPLSTMPAGVLRAGAQGIQILHRMDMGTPPAEHGGVESNVAAFVLRPTITGLNASTAEVTVTVDVTVGQAQRAVVLLNELNAQAPAAYTFVSPPRTADSTVITIPIRGVKPGEYLVRMQVDGAESLLNADTDEISPTFNQYIGPKVTIP